MPVDARPFTDPEIMADSNKTGTAATRKRLKGENSCDDPSHEVPKRKKVYNTWEFCGVCVSVWCTGAGGGGGGGGVSRHWHSARYLFYSLGIYLS